jgi:hypothetical protein
MFEAWVAKLVQSYSNTGLHADWHPDWLGPLRLYSSPSRTVMKDVAFSPFGEQYQGPAVDTYFTGVGQSVEAADLRMFPARNLSAVAGRWQSPDPAGGGGFDEPADVEPVCVCCGKSAGAGGSEWDDGKLPWNSGWRSSTNLATHAVLWAGARPTGGAATAELGVNGAGTDFVKAFTRHTVAGTVLGKFACTALSEFVKVKTVYDFAIYGAGLVSCW